MTGKNKLILSSGAVVLAALPAIVLFFLITSYSVNVPHQDDWITGYYVFKSANGQLSILDFLHQNADSWMFFPQLLFYVLAVFSHWDVRYQMILNLLFSCIISLNLYVLSRFTLKIGNKSRLLLLALANLVLFSPANGEIWLWATSAVLYSPVVCLTTSLVICYSSLSFKSKFFLSVLLATIATFSYSNGLLCWLLIFPSIVFNLKKEKKHAKTWSFFFLLGMALIILLYFWNYRFSGLTFRSSEYFLSNLKLVIQFFLIYLGSPCVNFAEIPNIIILGFAMLVLLAGCVIYCFYRGSNKELFYRSLPWLTIACYSLISGILITFGRSMIGPELALDRKYFAFSSYLPVALIFLMAINCQDFMYRYRKWRKLVTTLLVLLLLSFTTVQLMAGMRGITKMQANKQTRLGERAYLAFIKVLPKHQGFYFAKGSYFAVHYDAVSSQIPSIRKAGNWKLPYLESSDLSAVCSQEKTSAINFGILQGIRQKNDLYEAYGHASLPQRKGSADAVLLSYKNENGSPVLLNYVIPYFEQITGRRNKHSPEDVFTEKKWRISFSTATLPRGAVEITAWAYNALSGKAYPLKNKKTDWQSPE